MVSREELQAWATASAKTLRQQVSSLLEEIVRQSCGWRETADEVTGVTRALKAILKVWFFFFSKRNELLLRIHSRGVLESHCQKLTSYFWATPRRYARVGLFFSSTLLPYAPPMSSAKMPLPSLRLSNAPEQPAPVFQSSHAGPPSPILPWES